MMHPGIQLTGLCRHTQRGRSGHTGKDGKIQRPVGHCAQQHGCNNGGSEHTAKYKLNKIEAMINHEQPDCSIWSFGP
jgi:hypothetical protein